HDAAEVVPAESAPRQVIAGEGISGVRARLVVGPGDAAEAGEGPEAAVAPDDHVGKVYGPTAVAALKRYRRGQELDPGSAEIRPARVHDAADEADLRAAVLQHPLSLLPWPVLEHLYRNT